MPRSVIGGLILLFILAGCSTTPPALSPVIVEQSVGNEDYRKLNEIELLLLAYTTNNDADSLVQAEKETAQLLANPSLNKDYEARVHGLYGEIMYYSGKVQAAKKAIQEVEVRSKNEPGLYILKALLASKPEEKAKILEAGMKAAPQAGRLILNLAEVYFALGEFSKATGLYDDAFLLLDIQYKQHYLKNRDIAYQFMLNPPDTTAAKDYIGVEKLMVADVLEILLQQTTYLDAVAVKKKANPGELLQKLKEADYFYPANLELNTPILRKDLAYLILSIISRLENKPEIMHAYAKQYNEKKMKSPVPDIALEDYFFDAALNLVEREIMELPDGIHFFPGNTVSGMDLHKVLKALKDYYAMSEPNSTYLAATYAFPIFRRDDHLSG